MVNKQDKFYFDNFLACADFSLQAAGLLKAALVDFQPDQTQERLSELHAVEHAADGKRHEMTDRLTKAFITPVEREDLVALSQHIDEMTDKIEEVFIRIYINDVQRIRPEAIQMLDAVIDCCQEVHNLLKEFADFRHSKTLKDSVIRINSLEEDVDQLFISSMRALHTESADFYEVIAWREIYTYLEKCADACEHVADVVQDVVMKNS